jgi:oxygen-independent coproporphyrinogen-3 oxidase
MEMVCKAPLLFDTLYLGGGTPSLLKAEVIDFIIETARNRFKFLKAAEITVEVNPGTVTFDQLKTYHRAGVNRINIGVQSFDQSNLDFLGRIHTVDDAIYILNASRKAGFENIGLDLIYGIPGQTLTSWLADLVKAVEFAPEHLACYMLTYEPKTPLSIARGKGEFNPLSEKIVVDLFETTHAFLTTNGYEQYEISNFSKKAIESTGLRRSRHNQKYWSGIPYLGLGPSAHSFFSSKRQWNHRSVRRYINDLNNGVLPIMGQEVLTRSQRMIEAFYLGLRQKNGITFESFNQAFGVDFEQVFRDVIPDLEEKELIEADQHHLSLSQKGLLFLDSITEMFITHPGID